MKAKIKPRRQLKAKAAKTKKKTSNLLLKVIKPLGTKVKKKSSAEVKLRLVERRKHPRFLLTREQFKETKTGKIFTVFDLSFNGLSIHLEEKHWPIGAIVPGVLNLHPDSIEIQPRVVAYYGERAALKIESLSTYARGVLQKALSPKRLGASLKLVKEQLPFVDYWYNGSCNTDLLIKLNPQGQIAKLEIFFSNFYWSWIEQDNVLATGVCQSIGREQREEMLFSEAPVKLESIHLALDAKLDLEKLSWARGILEASPIDPLLKEGVLKKI